MTFANNMNQIFGLDIPANNLPVVIAPTTNTSNTPIKKVIGDLEKDFKTTRDNIDTIMDTGTSALTKVIEMLDNTDHPRWAEAAALLIKSMTDANREYMESHKKLSEINRNNNSQPGGDVNIEKAVIYTGTGADMIKQFNPRQ